MQMAHEQRWELALRAAGGLLALLLGLSAAAAAGAQTNASGTPPAHQPVDRCLECHASATVPELAEPARQLTASAHRDARIGCTGCHGGDPEDPTVHAHQPSAGFIGRPTRAEVPQRCGGCHADPRIMRRFSNSLPIDQWALYGSSKHGQLAAAGDPAAPVCTDCHGSHDISAAADPDSSVRRTKVAELCGGCHADRERMAAFRLPTDSLVKWKRSAHAEALARGDDEAPSCSGCHDAHGIAMVGGSSVARACADCHEQELEPHRRSAHAKPFERLGLEPCTACHGWHDVPADRPLLLSLGPNGSCAACHSADEPAAAIIDQLEKMLRPAVARADGARAELKRARKAGLAASPPEAALAELDRAEARLRLAVHEVDPQALTAPLGELEAAAAQLEQAGHWTGRGPGLGRAIYLTAGALGLALVGLAVYAVRRRRGRKQ